MGFSVRFASYVLVIVSFASNS